MSAGIYRTFQVFGEVPSGGIGYVAKRVICWGEDGSGVPSKVFWWGHYGIARTWS